MSAEGELPKDHGSRPHYRLRCLGDFQLFTATGDDVTPKGRKARALIAFLVSRDSKGVSRDRLCALLWSERGEEQARASLRETLTELRPLAEGATKLLSIDRDHVSLEAGAVDSDVAELKTAAIARDFERLGHLVASWQGKLFADLNDVDPSFDEWLRTERQRQQEQIVSAAIELADTGLEHGHVDTVRGIIANLRQLVPTNEDVLRLENRIDRASEEGNEIGDGVAAAVLPEAPSELAEETPAVTASQRSVVSSTDDVAIPPVGTPDQKPKTRRPYVAWAATATIFAAVLIGLFLVRNFDRSTAAPIPRLALPYLVVLPFDNLSDNPDLNYFTDGVSADIQASLARFISGIRLAELSTGFRFRGEGKKPANVKALINASHVVDGSVRRDGDNIRVVVQLIETGKGQVVWAEVYDQDIGRVLNVQGNVARRTAETFQVAAPKIPSANPLPPIAVEHYLRAMELFGQGLEDSSRAARAVGELEAATRAAPDFAAASAALELAHQARTQSDADRAPAGDATPPSGP
jgi:TolB-like protein/DNA-binding SARP family transcriptional activator